MCHLQGRSNCKVEGDPFAAFDPGRTRADPVTGFIKDESVASSPLGPVAQVSDGVSSRSPTLQLPGPSQSVPDVDPDGQSSDEVQSHGSMEVEIGITEDTGKGKGKNIESESDPVASTGTSEPSVLWSDHLMVSPTSTLETLVPSEGSRPLLPLVTRYWIESHDHYEDMPKEQLMRPTANRPTGPLSAWRCVRISLKMYLLE